MDKTWDWYWKRLLKCHPTFYIQRSHFNHYLEIQISSSRFQIIILFFFHNVFPNIILQMISVTVQYGYRSRGRSWYFYYLFVFPFIFFPSSFLVRLCNPVYSPADLFSLFTVTRPVFPAWNDWSVGVSLASCIMHGRLAEFLERRRFDHKTHYCWFFFPGYN